VFGKYSYSRYLFHPVLIRLLADAGFGKDTLPEVAGSRLPAALLLFVVATALALLVAMATWRVVERPALALKRHFPD
jgi:peptidoglycan/LPS O-acetylase OafA/YrhL